MQRTHCASCDHDELDMILNLGSTPLADEFPTEPDVDQQRWPLELYVCARCWLVQLGEIVPAAVLYGATYGFRSGASPTLARYFADYAAWLEHHFGQLMAGALCVEVACNDGTLLSQIPATGRRLLGIEPSAAADDVRNRDVVAKSFGLRTALDVRSEYGRAKVIIANNVLAHVAEPRDFLAGVRALLDDDGVFVAEVQYLPDLLLGNGIDLIYHEHRLYLTVDAVARMGAEHGLVVLDVEWTAAQGGSVRIVMGGPKTAHLGWGTGQLYRREEAPLRQASAYAGLQARAERLRDRLLHTLDRETADGRRIVALGAPAKATTLLNWCWLDGDLITAAHDLTPGKAGRFLPGTGIPIVGTPLPSDDAASCTSALVLPHNYLAGILQREAKFRTAGGRFVVPLPTPVVL